QSRPPPSRPIGHLRQVARSNRRGVRQAFHQRLLRGRRQIRRGGALPTLPAADAAAGVGPRGGRGGTRRAGGRAGRPQPAGRRGGRGRVIDRGRAGRPQPAGRRGGGGRVIDRKHYDSVDLRDFA
ncbi:unnamed protein product, partial [Ectocarpus sp. 13 AM-2016]